MIENRFKRFGAIGLLPEVGRLEVDPMLEQLVVLIKSARPHEHASYALRLANALEIPGDSLGLIRQIQRCYGYGQNLDADDVAYFKELQHILDSVGRLIENRIGRGVDRKGFLDFNFDPLQQRVELFRTLSTCGRIGDE